MTVDLRSTSSRQAQGDRGQALSPGALRLAGLAARALGWRPPDFWAATPAELAAILAPDLSEPPLDRTGLEHLMEHDR